MNNLVFNSLHKYSKMEQMKTLVEERLTAAVEDVLGIIDNVIKYYEEKDSRSKSEISRQNSLLDVFLKPKTTLQIADPPQLYVCKDDVDPEQQEWSPSLDRDDPEPPLIKEEQEENWTSQEEEQLQYLEETDAKDSIYTVSCMRSLHDQHQSQFPHQTVENREGEPLPGTSSEHMETEADGEGYGVAEPTNICNMKFNLKSTLTPHMNTYTGDRPHVCSVCGKGFNQVRDMYRHKTIHTGEKPYSCSVCEKGFSRRDNLREHMRIHTGEKPYSCSLCGEGFSRRNSVQVHMMTHTGERPYSCSVCGKGFIKSSGLKTHMKNHTGERPYVCSICGKGFGRRDSAQVHMKTHTCKRP